MIVARRSSGFGRRAKYRRKPGKKEGRAAGPAQEEVPPGKRRVPVSAFPEGALGLIQSGIPVDPDIAQDVGIKVSQCLTLARPSVPYRKHTQRPGEAAEKRFGN